MTIEIFISHRSDDRDIAENLRHHITTLSDKKATVHVCHRMQGGAEWRKWIHEKIPRSKVFVLLFTGIGGNWTWCIFESGLFRGANLNERNRLAAIRSPKCGSLPAPIDDLQAYDGSVSSVRTFLIELIERNTLTDMDPLNTSLLSTKATELNDAANEISNLMSRERKQVDFFNRRIEITPTSKDPGDFLRDAIVNATEKSRDLLGLSDERSTWSEIKKNFLSEGRTTWVEEFEGVVSRMLADEHGAARGPVKQMLSPFLGLEFGNTFIPILSRVEKVENIPSLISLIFVPMPSVDQQMEDMELHAVPPRVTAIVKLLNMARRFRWDVAVPFMTDADIIRRQHLPSEERAEKFRNTFHVFLRALEALEEEGNRHRFRRPEYTEAVLEIEQGDPFLRSLYVRYEDLKRKLKMADEKDNYEEIIDAISGMMEINRDFLIFGLDFYRGEIEKITK